MESIPKFLASMITIIVGVLICVSFIISSVVVNSARTFHTSVITEMEASNFDEVTIEKCKTAAEKSSYVLDVEQTEPENGASTQTMYKVTLNYRLSAPIFGTVHNGEVVGYALAGMYPTDVAVEAPENPVTGDVFIYGDYEYRYNMYYHYAGTWSENEEYEGWGARVLDHTKTSYQRPLSMIGSTPVVSLRATYQDCTNLVKAPKIPNTIVYMQYAYERCDSLTDVNINIPGSVRTLAYAFRECTSADFKNAPTIPEGVEDMTDTYQDCINLVTPSNVPSTVTHLNGTYQDCSSLESAPDLTTGTSLKQISSIFSGCTSLPSDMSNYIIPSTVTSGYRMFENCTQLVSAPVIPKKMTYISSIFSGCTSLTGNVTINCNPGYNSSIGWDEGEEVFKDTIKPIILIGDASDATKERLVATANNGNVTIYVESEEEASESN